MSQPDETPTNPLPSVTPGIRASIQQAVADVLVAVPDGKRGALVGVVTEDGVKVAVAARLGDVWTVVGMLDKPHDGPVTGSAQVTAAW